MMTGIGWRKEDGGGSAKKRPSGSRCCTWHSSSGGSCSRRPGGVIEHRRKRGLFKMKPVRCLTACSGFSQCFAVASSSDVSLHTNTQQKLENIFLISRSWGCSSYLLGFNFLTSSTSGRKWNTINLLLPIPNWCRPTAGAWCNAS